MRDSDYSIVQIYKWFIIKEKAIYNYLNYLKSGEKILIGLMWCPAKYRQSLDAKISELRDRRSFNPP